MSFEKGDSWKIDIFKHHLCNLSNPHQIPRTQGGRSRFASLCWAPGRRSGMPRRPNGPDTFGFGGGSQGGDKGSQWWTACLLNLFMERAVYKCIDMRSYEMYHELSWIIMNYHERSWCMRCIMIPTCKMTQDVSARGAAWPFGQEIHMATLMPLHGMAVQRWQQWMGSGRCRCSAECWDPWGSWHSTICWPAMLANVNLFTLGYWKGTKIAINCLN